MCSANQRRKIAFIAAITPFSLELDHTFEHVDSKMFEHVALIIMPQGSPDEEPVKRMEKAATPFTVIRTSTLPMAVDMTDGTCVAFVPLIDVSGEGMTP